MNQRGKNTALPPRSESWQKNNATQEPNNKSEVAQEIEESKSTLSSKTKKIGLGRPSNKGLPSQGEMFERYQAESNTKPRVELPYKEEMSEAGINISTKRESQTLMVIDIEVGKYTTRALVDSGASATLVSIKVAERLPGTILQREGILVGLAGQQRKFIGEIQDMEISIDGIPFKSVPILVVRDQDIPYPMILGANFYKKK